MHNWIGKVGSTLAFGLLGVIGGAAYLAPVLLVVFGLRSWVNEDRGVHIRHVLGAVLAILSLSTLFQLRFPSVPMMSDVAVGTGMAGGLSGYWLAWAIRAKFCVSR